MLLLIPKLLNMKAIHNCVRVAYKCGLLLLIPKLLNMKAIHNVVEEGTELPFVVTNPKVTEYESNSQLVILKEMRINSCY